MDFSFQALVQQHNAQMETAFRNLVDNVVRGSKLNISLLRISNVTEDSFHVSLEARLTKTGPASATITAMTLELCGPAGQFGKVTLPAIATRSFGTEVVVTSQMVKIIDQEALKAFIRDIIQNDSVILSLRNGKTTITALGIGPREIIYEKELELLGMKGPVVSVHMASIVQPLVVGALSSANIMPTSWTPLNTSLTTASISSTTAGLGSGSMISVVFHVTNPSTLEISFGTCFFDIQTHEGKLLAELKGRLDIRRHHFQATFQGTVNKAVAAKLATDMKAAATSESKDGNSAGETSAGDTSTSQSPGARLVGKRCAGAGWCDDTIKSIDVPLNNMGTLFRTLGMDAGLGEPGNKRSSFTKWQKLILR